MRGRSTASRPSRPERLAVLFLFRSSAVATRSMSSAGRIRRLMIANRGEIACRVMRTARRLGIETVAVYSDADANSMHVSMADEAHRIGPASSQLSYLDADKILSVAKSSRCDAVHPGYGFLSENAEFAQRCGDVGIVFVGPPASAIRDMGIKSTSKRIMATAGVPVVRGYHGDDQSNERLAAEALDIGFPVMIKAVRGGGGKGMRVARTREDFLPALESARSESMKAFGDGDVLLEQFVSEPRHVEVQVFADSHGGAVHLFERDCSVQRRHQKIIEEAPAPHVSWQLRNELGAAAVRAARAVNYVGAGTVEFILDRRTHGFHFMEMNTRLQVEHPITEMITGTDLVEWQLTVAAGGRLPLTQDDINLNGHAFEARIYAEDPDDNFLPRPGPLRHLSTPAPSADVRIETGVREGDEVSIHYDPMIAKLVVWGNSRTEALSKLTCRLAEFNVSGVETNVNFLLALSRHAEFVAGNVHTNFIDEHRAGLFPVRATNESSAAKAALVVLLHERSRELDSARASNDPFATETCLRINHELVRELTFDRNGNDVSVRVKHVSPGRYRVRFDGSSEWRDLSGELTAHGSAYRLAYTFDGATSACRAVVEDEYVQIFDESGGNKFTSKEQKFVSEVDKTVADAYSNVGVAPMPGVLEKLYVAVGDSVKRGDPLFVIVAMKMEHVVRAVDDVTVGAVNFRAGETVSKNAIVVLFDER